MVLCLPYWPAIIFVRFILIAVSVAPLWSSLFTDDEHVRLVSFWAPSGATSLVVCAFFCVRAGVS